MSSELAASWSHIQAHLRRAVAPSTYDLWLAALVPRELSRDTLTIEASAPARAWVATRFLAVLERCAQAVLGPQVAVVVTADPGQAPPAESSDLRACTAPMRLDPRHTFEQFVIGDDNRLAHAAALTVAEMPAQAYNPLVICGAPGLGKTHLLHAIATYLATHAGHLRVRYATGETFANHFRSALRAHGQIDDFKASYRANDVLLLDDADFLEGKAQTETELRHTVEALYERGGQLVLTADRPPKSLATLDHRLRERLGGGLVAQLDPPDLATRLAILRMRARRDSLTLTDSSALEVIAQRVTGNIRLLEGALIGLVARHSLTRRPIDAALAEEYLGTVGVESAQAPVSLACIESAVAAELDVETDVLHGNSRARRLVWARQVAMYLARELTEASLPAIAHHFGGHHHTTVLHACRRVRDRLAVDDGVRNLIARLTERASTP